VKVLVLASLPLAERHPTKAAFLEGVAAARSSAEVVLAFDNISPASYLRAVQREGGVDSAVRKAKLLGRSLGPVSDSINNRTGDRLDRVALGLGFRVHYFSDFRARRMQALVSEFGADIAFNLSVSYVPPFILDGCGLGVVGAHYGDLPRFRGGDTVRWTILQQAPLVVSTMLLRAQLDTGPVLTRCRIPVERGDDVARLRTKCQVAASAERLRVFERAREGVLQPDEQDLSQGSTFFKMGSHLRARVDSLLSKGEYVHYEPGGEGCRT
jgi:hypothetical protein